MKTIRKISKEYYVRQIMASWLAFYMLFFLAVPVRVTMADDIVPGMIEGQNPTNGGAVFNTAGNTVTVTTDGPATVIEYNRFNIDTGWTVDFVQPDAAAATLNRIIQANPSLINGALTSNGRIFIVNPAGVIFGEGATVNVAQLVASSLKLANNDFIKGLDNGQFKFTDGVSATGSVENNTDITGNRIALIGKEVINSGTLVAQNGYVVLAAGATVILTENGSNVSVAVEMPPPTVEVPEPDIHAFKVNNSSSGDGIEAYGENAQVILAAGDVWSAALVKAYSPGGSDAVATVEIDAAGDVCITDDVIAEAVGNGVDNATAAVTINAGGDVEIKEGGEGWWTNDTEITATAREGLNNTATVDISADGDVCISAAKDGVKIQANADPEIIPSVLNQADVLIQGVNVTIETSTEGIVDWFLSEDALVGAYANGASENRASVEITATGSMVEDVLQGGNVTLNAGGSNDSALVEAVAQDGSTNSADVTITAAGNVDVTACSDAATVRAEASNELDETDLDETGTIAGLTNTANINITAGGSVLIKGQSNDDAVVEAVAMNTIDLTTGIPVPEIVEQVVQIEEAPVLDLVIEDLTNTANVNITANNGSVEITGQNSGASATVKSTAANEIAVDIENGEVPVIVNLTMSGLENNAGVTINANGECSNVVVQGDHGYGLVRAEAYNTLDIEHKGDLVDEGQWEDHGFWWWGRWISHWVWVPNLVFYPVAQAAVNLTVDGLLNNAAVSMTAANGSVQVMADGGYWSGWWWDMEFNPYTAGVKAAAYNKFDLDDMEDEVTTANFAFNNITNNAGIDIAAGLDVEVLAYNGGHADITASAWNELNENEEASDEITADNITNDAAVAIDAAGDVKVKAECEGDCSEAEIAALAYNVGDTSIFVPEVDPENTANITNTANVDIAAGENVKVIGKYCGEARIIAETLHGTENTSGVTVNSGGDVLILGVNGDASIEAVAEEGGDNTATIGINAVGGDVKVIDIGEGGDTAKIEARAEVAINSNTADVTINATATTSEYEFEGETYLEVDGGDVLVIAKDGGDAAITAFAAGAGDEEDPIEVETSNTANVTINATAAQGTMQGKLVTDAVYENDVLIEPAVYEVEAYTEGGDVKVIAECGGEAEIEAIAMQGQTNTSGVLVCTHDGGSVKVEGSGGEAEIEALTKYGYFNTSSVAVCADQGVLVKAEYGGSADIFAGAFGGRGSLTDTAQTIVHSQGDLWVIGNGGEAGIGSAALDGDFTDAFTAVCATGDILVVAGIDPENIKSLPEGGIGGYASIYSEAGSGRELTLVAQPEQPDGETSTADARTVAVSHEGSVVVADLTGYGIGSAGITAEAHDAFTNTASVGVAAGADLSPASTEPISENPVSAGTGNVIVAALGPWSDARIMSYAYDGFENIADTVVCAPGKVLVTADGERSLAKIKSLAEYGELNTATTQVYADEVEVDVPGLYRGNGISAWADGTPWVHADSEYCFKAGDSESDGAIGIILTSEDGTATSTLIIDSYANRKDCPTCPPCPCEQQAAAAAVTPPLPQIRFPEASGCPALMDSVANELGVSTQTIQIAFAGGTSVAPNIQPCSACEGLVSYAEILKDADGSHMAALAQVFNTLAPSDAPFTPEMGAAIAAAFAENFDNPDMPQYAKAMEYIDAFTGYVAALDDLGSPVGDSTAFVMGKYGEPLTASNPNMTAYIQMQIAEAQGI